MKYYARLSRRCILLENQLSTGSYRFTYNVQTSISIPQPELIRNDRTFKVTHNIHPRALNVLNEKRKRINNTDYEMDIFIYVPISFGFFLKSLF